MSWPLAAGFAALTPFLIDQLLDHPGIETPLRIMTAVAAVASLVSLMLLAMVRGDLLAQQIRESENQTVVIDDAAPQQQATNNFYDKTTGLLCAALLLMAFANEVGGGLILHAAWRSMPDDSEDWKGLRRELIRIRGRLAEIACQIVMLRNAPRVIEAKYWRDFYRALLLNATRSAVTKLAVMLLAFVAFAVLVAHAEVHLNLVIAIDLTRSVATQGPDGKTDFQKNVDGVIGVLAQVPLGARITIIGITDRSNAEPYMLMRAQVPRDSGYFGENLASARRELVRAWLHKAAKLTPSFKQIDIFGSLELASQLFAENPNANRKELVIFSDMRESMPGVDFEQMKLVPGYPALKVKCVEPPDLRGVRVSLAGVDGFGKSIVYWNSLRRFWAGYFESAGATFESFSALTEVALW